MDIPKAKAGLSGSLEQQGEGSTQGATKLPMRLSVRGKAILFCGQKVAWRRSQ